MSSTLSILMGSVLNSPDYKHRRTLNWTRKLLDLLVFFSVRFQELQYPRSLPRVVEFASDFRYVLNTRWTIRLKHWTRRKSPELSVFSSNSKSRKNILEYSKIPGSQGSLQIFKDLENAIHTNRSHMIQQIVTAFFQPLTLSVSSSTSLARPISNLMDSGYPAAQYLVQPT